MKFSRRTSLCCATFSILLALSLIAIVIPISIKMYGEWIKVQDSYIPVVATVDKVEVFQSTHLCYPNHCPVYGITIYVTYQVDGTNKTDTLEKMAPASTRGNIFPWIEKYFSKGSHFACLYNPMLTHELSWKDESSDSFRKGMYYTVMVTFSVIIASISIIWMGWRILNLHRPVCFSIEEDLKLIHLLISFMKKNCIHCGESTEDTDIDHIHLIGGCCMQEFTMDICDRHMEKHDRDPSALNDRVSFDKNFNIAYSSAIKFGLLTSKQAEGFANIYARSWDTTFLFPDSKIDKCSYARTRAITVLLRQILTVEQQSDASEDQTDTEYSGQFEDTDCQTENEYD